MVEGRSRRKDTSACCTTEASGERVGGVRAQEREGVPSACEDVWREDAETTGADAQGSWDEAIDMCPVQEGVWQCLCSDAVRGLMGALSEQASFQDRGFLSPFACATEVEGRQHVLTQWAHKISPFVRRVICLRRKTSETACRRESGLLTAAPAAYLNIGLELTASSVRSSLAPASGSSSGPAFGGGGRTGGEG